MLPPEFLGLVEAAFRASRLDLNGKARLCAEMIEEFEGIKASREVRARMEELLVHGVTPEHIKRAVEVLRQS